MTDSPVTNIVSSASGERNKAAKNAAGESKWAIPLDMTDGYCDGFAGSPEPGDNRSHSYRHGWKVGASDRKGAPAFATAELGRQAAQEAIERDYTPAVSTD